MIDIFKRFMADDLYFYTILLILISVTSFGLGRLSVAEVSSTQKGTVVLSKQPVEGEYGAITNNVASTEEQQLVGSKNGSKYHALWCPGASQIKEENKVFFISEKEAKAKGYSKAGNCDI